MKKNILVLVFISNITSSLIGSICPFVFTKKTFAQIPGHVEAKNQLKYIVDFMKNSKVYDQLGGKMGRGILLSGKPGNYRTQLVLATATEIGCPVYCYSAATLLNLYIETKRNPVPELFQKARQHGKCIIFIGDVDVFSNESKENEQISLILKGILLALLNEMETSYQNNEKILVIGKCQDSANVNPLLTAQGFFETSISVNMPTTLERELILKEMLKKVKTISHLQLKPCVINTQRFTIRELEKLVNKAALLAGNKKLAGITEQELEEARQSIIKAHKNPHSHFNAVTSTTKFKDIAGAEGIKEELADVVAFLKNPDIYNSLGAQMGKGILFYGPPGNGKTYIAKALAGEANCSFFSVSASEFVEKYVGVGASRVRELFEQARQTAPSIIFIDEIDSIGGKRDGKNSTIEHDQTLNQLLVEMDGFNTSEKPVIIIAATNRPDVLDKALLRSGRFDLHIKIPHPDTKARYEILKLHAQKTKLDTKTNLEMIAEKTQGFAAADLANLINRAAILAARKGLKAVTQEELEQAHKSLLHILIGH